MSDPGPQSDRAILDLLAAARQTGAPATEAPETAEYDWQSPNRFSPVQLRRLKDCAERIAEEVSTALGDELRDEISLEVGAIEQRYARQLAEGGEEDSSYFLQLTGGGGSACGFVSVPAARARGWVLKLLGGMEQSGEGKELSSLELALLVDIISAAAKAMLAELRQAGGASIGCRKELVTRAPLPEGEPTADYVLLRYSLAGDTQGDAVTFVVASDLLVPVVGAGEGEEAPSADELRGRMLACIEREEITGEVHLGTAELTVRDVMGLAEGDVVLIDRNAGEPVELKMYGKTIASGYPVRCEGHYAILLAAGISGGG